MPSSTRLVKVNSEKETSRGERDGLSARMREGPCENCYRNLHRSLLEIARAILDALANIPNGSAACRR